MASAASGWDLVDLKLETALELRLELFRSYKVACPARLIAREYAVVKPGDIYIVTLQVRYLRHRRWAATLNTFMVYPGFFRPASHRIDKYYQIGLGMPRSHGRFPVTKISLGYEFGLA